MIHILPVSIYILYGDETKKPTDLLLPSFIGKIQSISINTESKNQTMPQYQNAVV